MPIRSDVPPAAPGTYWVERIKGGGKGTFTCYSPQFWGFTTHYTGGRTKFCYENTDFCEGGHNEKTLRWNGYLFCWSHTHNKRVFVHFTDCAARMLQGQIQEKATLRGVVFDLMRTTADNGRYRALINKWMPAKDTETLPPNEDPLLSLFKLFGMPAKPELLRRSLVGSPEDIPDLRQTG